MVEFGWSGSGLSLEERLYTFCVERDEEVHVVCVRPSRVLRHEEDEGLPRLGVWGVAVGECERYSFGDRLEEALVRAMERYAEKSG